MSQFLTVFLILGLLFMGLRGAQSVPAHSPDANSPDSNSAGSNSKDSDSIEAPEPLACLAAPDVHREVAVQDDRRFSANEDPVYHRTFSAAVMGLVFEEGAWQRRFTVYYNRPDEHELARTCAEVLARLYCIGEARLAPHRAFLDSDWQPMNPVSSQRRRHSVALYIVDGGRAGGEEEGGRLYLLRAEQPRDPVELARELSHEYSHLVIPGIRGFSSARGAEDWGNGYLGEVLFTGWLGEDTGLTRLPAASVGEWSRARAAALEGAFLHQGPNFFRRPRANFWEFEGMMLYLGETCGSEFLADLLAASTNTTADDTMQKIADTAGHLKGFSVKVPGSLAAEEQTGNEWRPRRVGTPCVLGPGAAIRQLVFLNQDDYRIHSAVNSRSWSLRSAIIGSGDETSILGAESETSPNLAFPSERAGWYLLQWRNTGAAPVTIDHWTWSPVKRPSRTALNP